MRLSIAAGMRKTQADLSKREVHCPGCRRLVEYSPDNPYRPFCCRRCKEGDLGAWASGSYAVEASPDEKRDDETAS